MYGGVESGSRFREIHQGGGNGKTYFRGDVRKAPGGQQESDDEATERIQGTIPTRWR
jgi:hypothetical protein